LSSTNRGLLFAILLAVAETVTSVVLDHFRRSHGARAEDGVPPVRFGRGHSFSREVAVRDPICACPSCGASLEVALKWRDLTEGPPAEATPSFTALG
jgi:hypothetical protein